MTGCSIRKCKSRSVKGGSTMFFSFPREEAIANEWLRHCGPKTTAKHGRVCSNHFLPSDYLKPHLRHILLNISPKHDRKLKPDAIPTLQLDRIDKQNTLKVKNEIIHTPEIMSCLPQCNTIAANEVVGSSNVFEKRPIEDEQNTPNVKLEMDILHTTENMNCLPQCNAIPAYEVAGLSKVLEKRPINDKQNTPDVTAEEDNEIILTTENVNCLTQWTAIQTNSNTHTIPANEVGGSSKVINKRYSTDQPPIKPICRHNTNAYQCSKLNSNDVLIFNKAFYASNDKIKQDNFILKHIVSTATSRKRPKTGNKPGREMALKYFIPKNKKGKALIPVCKNTFLGILNLKKGRLDGVAKRHYVTGSIAVENRGGDRKTHTYRLRKEAVEKYIQTLQPLEIHNCRYKARPRQNVHPELIKKLWNMYSDGALPGLSVSFSLFRKIFVSTFNIGYGCPRQDGVCSTCLQLMEKISRKNPKNDSEKVRLNGMADS